MLGCDWVCVGLKDVWLGPLIKSFKSPNKSVACAGAVLLGDNSEIEVNLRACQTWEELWNKSQAHAKLGENSEIQVKLMSICTKLKEGNNSLVFNHIKS